MNNHVQLFSLLHPLELISKLLVRDGSANIVGEEEQRRSFDGSRVSRRREEAEEEGVEKTAVEGSAGALKAKDGPASDEKRGWVRDERRW